MYRPLSGLVIQLTFLQLIRVWWLVQGVLTSTKRLPLCYSHSVTLTGVLQCMLLLLYSVATHTRTGAGKCTEPNRRDGHSLPSHIAWSTVHFTTTFKPDFYLINRHYPKGSQCNSSFGVAKLSFLSLILTVV